MLDLLAFKATEVPAKNLIENGNFMDGLKGWYGDAEIDYLDGEGVFYRTESSNLSYFSISSSIFNPEEINAGDVIYYSLMEKVENHESLNFFRIIMGNAFSDGFKRILSNGEYTKHSFSKKWADIGNPLQIRLYIDHREFPDDILKTYIKNVMVVNLTKTFGKGNEPSAEQMDVLLESRFDNGYFDGTKNLFNAKEFMNNYHKKIKELENAIISLGGELP